MEGTKPVTVVTGGSGAIGSAVIASLAAQGHRVINVSLEETEKNDDAHFFAADLTDREATAEVLGRINREYRVDNLVNNAGFTYVTELQSLSFDRMQAMVDIHLRAAAQCIQAFAPAMAQNGRGRIVSIGSRMMLGRPGRMVYGMVKAGLLGMSRSLALELAHQGITVNMVSPGPIETALFRQNHPPGAPQTEKVLGAIPVGRIGTPEDVAHAVKFFLADESGFITGQNLFVCGGGSVGSAVM
ncbi:NAD(P)-dependent dehydrogenase (short-subunit alcohol dehydrogenase family) [Paraburkholderia sp. BL27I4N3]|uniref:SDR family oxidoreductase n=1 Tax=Paraburkholderia sp. BL27I4N3 TaxID=1938805 RepID=UPI000E2557F1|nr:SDR family oxidoreductase [Paraburkholderia sp. BL27I4N3]REE17730.1 NAD(P)-dependent dehydrogenase (short-subunit alcohol dehydrogenase family) [Paraburkholderia sp. BL27I4N3]